MRYKWIIKALTQKIISYTKHPEKINYLFQKYITKGVVLSDEHFRNKITHARDHINYFHKYSDSVNNARILELGTGWYPIVPVSIYICDVGSMVSIDIQDWLNANGVITTIKKFKEWHEKGMIKEILPLLNESKLLNLISYIDDEDFTIDSFKNKINLETYLKDARDLKFNDGYFDFICSNNTFEHIYPDVLSSILDEFSRVVKKGGVMSHFIDLSDHFAHFDNSISIYNFLKFSEKIWSCIDNSIQPQNRMRWPEYIELYNSKGIIILHQDFRVGDISALNSITINNYFSQFKNSENAISHGYIISIG